MSDDALHLVLTSLGDTHDIGALLAIGATSRRLSLLSHAVVEHMAHFSSLVDVVPLLLVLPLRLQDCVQVRCRRAIPVQPHLFGRRLYHAVQRLLQNEVQQSIKWLIVMQWSLQLRQDMRGDVLTTVRRWRWRKIESHTFNMDYKYSGLDDVAASVSLCPFQGGLYNQAYIISVADWFATHCEPASPLTRPDLPCILAGPSRNPDSVRLPLELLKLPLPSPENPTHSYNPQPEQLTQLPPAVRALVEYVRAPRA